MTMPLAPGRVAPMNGAPPAQAQLDSVSVVSSAMENGRGSTRQAYRVAYARISLSLSARENTWSSSSAPREAELLVRLVA